MESICKHCGVSIINVPALGKRWMHIPKDPNKFHQPYVFCELKFVAEPVNVGTATWPIVIETDPDIPRDIIALRRDNGMIVGMIINYSGYIDGEVTDERLKGTDGSDSTNRTT